MRSRLTVENAKVGHSEPISDGCCVNDVWKVLLANGKRKLWLYAPLEPQCEQEAAVESSGEFQCCARLKRFADLGGQTLYYAGWCFGI